MIDYQSSWWYIFCQWSNLNSFRPSLLSNMSSVIYFLFAQASDWFCICICGSCLWDSLLSLGGRCFFPPLSVFSFISNFFFYLQHNIRGSKMALWMAASMLRSLVLFLFVQPSALMHSSLPQVFSLIFTHPETFSEILVGGAAAFYWTWLERQAREVLGCWLSYDSRDFEYCSCQYIWCMYALCPTKWANS